MTPSVCRARMCGGCSSAGTILWPGRPVVRPEGFGGPPLIVSRQMVGENGLSGWLGYDYEKLHIVSTGNLVNNLILLVEEGWAVRLPWMGW